MKLIDLTHLLTDKMPTYPCDPAPSLTKVASIGKDGYLDHKLETTMHVGTHIDAPAHMIEGGKRIDELPLELFYGKGIAVDVRGKKVLDLEAIQQFGTATIFQDSIVLFCTGFSKKYRTPLYFTDYPVMTEALARELAWRKIKMIGLDTPSPDLPLQTGRAPYAVHKILLCAGVLIIENLTNIETLLGLRAFAIEAFPLRVCADAAPVRVIARA